MAIVKVEDTYRERGENSEGYSESDGRYAHYCFGSRWFG